METVEEGRVGVLLPTWKAEKYLPICLPPLLAAACRPKIVIIDSSSPDATVAIAKEYGIEQILVIPQREFDHGRTREKGRKLLQTPIVVMVTQDINPEIGALDRLVEPLLQGNASIAYGRQLPHHGAGLLEAFSRHFNYGQQSFIAGIEQHQTLGAQLFFCSNAFAAYSTEALDSIGGFRSTLFGEDTLAVAELIRQGHKIAYSAEAVVRHSHNYSLLQEFRRHFDIGLSRKLNASLLECSRSDTKRGSQYAKKLLSTVAKEAPSLLPYAIAQLACKWAGYQCGKYGKKAPLWFKKRVSSQPAYWD